VLLLPRPVKPPGTELELLLPLLLLLLLPLLLLLLELLPLALA